MRFAVVVSLALSTLVLASCESRTQRAQRLLREFNADHLDYAERCVPSAVGDYAGIADPAARKILTGEKVTDEEHAAYETQVKAREAECKPLNDRYHQIEREFYEAQQAAGAH